MAFFVKAIGITRRRLLVALVLLGIYLTARFALSYETWPRAATFGLSNWHGVAGVALLTGCRFSASWAAKKPERARRWLLMTLALGAAFFFVRFTEYSVAMSRGALPGIGPWRSVHDEADLFWLSHVKEEINAKVLTTESVAKTPESKTRLGDLITIRDELVTWTSREVGMADDRSSRKALLEFLAWQIEPSGFTHAKKQQLLKLETDFERAAVESRDKVQNDLQVATLQLANLQSQIAANQKTAENASERDTLIRNAAETTRRINELTSQLNRARKRATALTKRFHESPSEASRLWGINRRFNLRLPIVVRNGNRWAWCFWPLTAVHTCWVAVAFWETFAILQGEKTAITKPRRVENVACQWHFVSVVYILLFFLLFMF